VRDKYLTPDAPASGFLCRTLRIPNGEECWAAVNGALLELTYPWNWEEHGTLTPDEAAALFVDMYEDYRESRGCVLGTIFTHALATIPDGALACDGATYNKSDYPTLYDSLDSAYIVDATSFRVPDLRGRSVIGTGQGSGLTARTIDSSGGEEQHALTVAEMPAHTHVGPHSFTVVPVVSPGELPVAVATGLVSTESTGGNGSHNTMHPFRALHYAIWAR